MLPRPAWQRVINVLLALGFSLYVPELDAGELSQSSALLNGLTEFREHLGGELTIMLLEDIGHGVETHDMDTAVILRCIQALRRLSPQSISGTTLVRLSDPEELWIDKAPARLQ
jgi:3-dehydroquinate synthase